MDNSDAKKNESVTNAKSNDDYKDNTDDNHEVNMEEIIQGVNNTEGNENMEQSDHNTKKRKQTDPLPRRHNPGRKVKHG